jgi:hypothetical protein
MPRRFKIEIETLISNQPYISIMDTYKITTMTNPLTIEDEDRKVDIYDKSIKALFFKDRHTIIVRRLYEEGEAVSTYNLTEESYHWKNTII